MHALALRDKAGQIVCEVSLQRMHAFTAMPGSRDSSKELVDVRELVQLSCACKLPMRTPHAAQGTLPYPTHMLLRLTQG